MILRRADISTINKNFSAINYDNVIALFARVNEDIGHSLLISSIILLALSYIAVILRLFTRRLQKVRLANSDYLIVVALILLTAMVGVVIRAVQLNFGRHIIVLSLGGIAQLGKLLYIIEVIFPICNGLVKLSVLLLYRAIFLQGHKNRIANYVNTTVLWLWVAVTVISSIVLAFQCFPIALSWSSDHTHSCINLEAATLALTVFVAILNVITLLIPVPIVWSLRLSTQTKAGVCVLFALGSCDIAICIARACVSRINAGIADFSWHECLPILLAIAEAAVGIICASMVVMRPLFVRCFGLMKTTFTWSRSQLGSITFRSNKGPPMAMVSQMSDLNSPISPLPEEKNADYFPTYRVGDRRKKSRVPNNTKADTRGGTLVSGSTLVSNNSGGIRRESDMWENGQYIRAGANSWTQQVHPVPGMVHYHH